MQRSSYKELHRILRHGDPSIADCEAIDLSQKLINEIQNGGELFFKNLAKTSLEYRLRYLNLLYLATQIYENAVEIKFPNWFIQQILEEQDEQHEREVRGMCEEFIQVEDHVRTMSPSELHRTSSQGTELKIRIPRRIFESVSAKK